MIQLYDRNMNQLNQLSFSELKEAIETAELNKQIVCNITYPYQLFEPLVTYFGYIQNDNLMLYKIIKERKEKDMIQLTGIHVFFDDLKGRVVRDKRPQNETAKRATEIVLEGTQWNVTSTVTHTTSKTFFYQSALKSFYEILDTWNCEFKLYINPETKSKHLILADTISKDEGKWFEYGDKLITVVSEQDHSTVFTGFIGRGKAEQTANGGYGRKIQFNELEWSIANGNPIDKPLGQDYVEIKELTSIFGYPDGTPKIAVVDFDHISERNKLIEATYQYALVNSRPKLQLTATAYSDSRIELGEVCAIIRPDLNIRYKTRVFKVVTNLLTQNQTFEFGDKLVKTQAERFTSLATDTETKVKEVESRLEERLNDITINFYNEDGYNYELKANNEYGLPAGYYSFNKPIDQNPTKVVYMGVGKVLIATSKNPNGEWEWRTAITPEGIYGQEIISKSITTNQLSSDVGQALDLSSNAAIINKVSQADYDHNGQLVREELTSLKQTTNRFQLDFVTRSDFNSEQTLNNNRHATINRYIRFIEGRIELGEVGNPIDLVIKNNRLEFRQNGTAVAWFSNNQLYVTDIEVTNRLIIAKSEIKQITPTIAGIGVTQ